MMKKINISNSNLITNSRFINHYKNKSYQGYNDGNYNLPLYNFFTIYRKNYKFNKK